MNNQRDESANHPPLEDRYFRQITYLRLAVTDRCNYRCVYCMPSGGIVPTSSKASLSYEEILRLARILVRVGVQRVRLTGGEPLVRRGIEQLVRGLVKLDGIKEVVMTTNAGLLSAHAEALRVAGLASITVSIDTLRQERFAQISRGGDLQQVLQGIDAALNAGFAPIKLNAVMIRGFNDDEVVELVDWAVDQGHILRLIELMPIGEATVWNQSVGGCFSMAEMLRHIAGRYVLEPLGMRGGAGPAKYFRVTDASCADRTGEIGFISAVSNCFCSSCNRIRLTPHGGLRACLADDAEIDLRAKLRAGADDDAIEATVRRALLGKKASHAFAQQRGAVTRTQMVSIGG